MLLMPMTPAINVRSPHEPAQPGNGDKEHVHLLEYFLQVEAAESQRVVGIHFVALRHQCFGAVLHIGHVHTFLRTDAEPMHGIKAVEGALERGERNVDRAGGAVVMVCIGFRQMRAHHLEEYALYPDVFADRIFYAEQRLHHLGADHAHFSAVVDVFRVQEAPFGNFRRLEIHHVRHVAIHVETRVFVFVTYIVRPAPPAELQPRCHFVHAFNALDGGNVAVVEIEAASPFETRVGK